jgi:nitrogen fixation/metabolism regulation signal transduction histidine kinase
LFKSIQYKFYFYTALLAVAVAVTAILLFTRNYLYAVCSIMLIFHALFGLRKCYKHYSQSFNFLLNALENGDYAFHFPETKLPAREKELNQIMNRIKDILANARKEVIDNEHFLSRILECASIGIFIIDDRGIVQRANRTALEMLGIPVFSHLNQLQSVNEDYPELFRQLKAGDKTQITLNSEREELRITLHVSQIRLKRGTMRIVSLNNIGNELEVQEIESWIRLFRVMAHEIMNFIAPITSLSETMLSHYRKHPALSEELKQNTLDAFETIHTTASGLLSFVESYRKFTAIHKPEKRDCDLKALIDKLVRLYEPVLREKDIRLTVTVYTPSVVPADENQISQVLVNLIKNAIEAIEASGEIALSIGQTASGNPCIQVANTGKPVPQDILPHIFVPFFTTKPSGSGVGLSVSRYIMRLHGGKLQHSRSKDEKTVFTLSF